VTGAGVVVDPVGLPVSMATGAKSGLSVASNGTDYLVSWTDGRAGGTDIYAARVSGAGVVLDPAGLPVTTGKIHLSPSSVASDGANYLVAWTQGGWYESDIYASRVSASGVVEDSEGIAVSTAAEDQLTPSVASNGSGYLVVWDDRRSFGSAIYASRVSVQGVVEDGAGVLVSSANGPRESPSVASNGEGYLVAWEDRRNNNWDVYASRVSAAGIVEDPDGLAVAASEDVAERTANASPNGSSYLVTWYNGAASGSTIQAASLIFDPHLEMSRFVIDADNTLPWDARVAWLGERGLVSYSERVGPPRLHLRLITPDCTSDPWGDADADGVCGSVDNCPDVANYDAKDSDGDSLGDACDVCPNDADKVDAGQCGCGAPDTDTDEDGTANCNDGCPTDAQKVDANDCDGSAQGGSGPDSNEGGGGAAVSEGGAGSQTSETGGTVGSGGTGGSGGANHVTSGGAANDESDEEEGDDTSPACGCRMAGENPGSPAAVLVFAAGIGLVVTRRRLRAA
jgi:hypothetical protein